MIHPISARRIKAGFCGHPAGHSALIDSRAFGGNLPQAIMPDIRKDHDGVHLDYSVTERQNFDQAAFGLLQLLQQAQRDYPNEPRHLHLTIEGHRLPNGAFDPDAFELQSKFLMEFLMGYLTSATIPLSQVRNPHPQKNTIPPLNIFRRDNPAP